MNKKFWAKVNKDGPTPSHMPHLGQCWIYGAGNSYGVVKWKGKSTTAHRVSWELINGAIPKGKMVLHHCDNPPCVNPGHLFIGTAKDNMEDALRKGRRPKWTNKKRLSLIRAIAKKDIKDEIVMKRIIFLCEATPEFLEKNKIQYQDVSDE